MLQGCRRTGFSREKAGQAVELQRLEINHREQAHSYKKTTSPGFGHTPDL
jgi:hypothetical protein